MNNMTKKQKGWLIATIILAVLLVFLKVLSKSISNDGMLKEINFVLINSALIILLAGSIIRLFFLFRNQLSTSLTTTTEKINKNNASKSLMATVIVSLTIITLFGTIQIIGDSKCEACNVYKAIGFILIMLWVCIFLCYFIWAIYFYNLNLGKTNSEWAKINEAKNNRSKGLPYNQKDIDEEPEYNPYKDETFGVPSGTVRGMIAFTLLFGAIALLIVSFGMSSEIKAGSFFMDQFEFFKTAFLMMIAFYFGSRSLQYLRNGTPGPVKAGDSNSTNGSNTDNPSTKPVVDNVTPGSGEVVVIDNTADKNPVADGTPPPIVPIDPMAPKKQP